MSGGLSNSDFRTMVMTPRRGVDPSAIADFKAPPTPKGGGKEKKKKFYTKKPKDDDITNPEMTPRYRDRAQERREGGGDYKEEEMKVLTSFNAVPPNQKGEEAAKTRKEVIERSKYLGGDMEHTHLVKGLDYALLQKTKSDMENSSKVQEDKEFDEIAEEQEQTYYQTIDIEKKKIAETIVEEEKTQFVTPMGKMIHNRLFDKNGKNSLKKNEMFINGRTLFIFDLDEGVLPTTVVKSKDDLPKFKELMMDKVEESVYDKVSTIISYIKGGGKKKKKENSTENSQKSQKQVTPTQPEKKKVADEDDIFPNMEEYKPTYNVAMETKPSEKKKYFETEEPIDMETDAPVLPEHLRKQLEDAKKKAGVGSDDDEPYEFDINQFDERIDPEILQSEVKPKTLQEELDAERSKKRSLTDPSKDPSYISGEYAECYPGTYESGSAFYEQGSDDDEDYSKMDVGRNLRLHRKDFASEEAWSSYNDNREALPKAAFQFGVKMSGGRKTRKHKSGDKKIESELKKINQIIKKKENSTAPSVPTALEARKKMKTDQ